MNEKISNKQWAAIFVLSWIAFNLLLCAYTDLAEDEAYYWLFAKYLDWGYFDHPPMIALMIRAGGMLFSEELGVRFFTAVFSGLTLYLLFVITKFENVKLLFLLFLTAPAFHAFGFISAPDVPLMFFGALYILLFKRFVEANTLKNAMLLGVVASLMMYSKYHGILLILFTFLPNITLLKRLNFWLMTLVALLLFLPHIFWQIANDYPSLRYHLVDRVNRPYEFNFTLQYFLGQLGLCGPILFILFFTSLRKTVTSFYATMKYSAVAIFAFFFLFSFRTFIEANWGAIAFVPVLLYAHSTLQDGVAKVWKTFSYIVVLILIALRVALVFPNDFLRLSITKQFYHDSEFYPKVKALAGDLPVVFMNTYQKPSKYYFYYNVPSFSLNSFWYRRNQFDKWPIQKDLQGKEVLLVATDNFDGAQKIAAKYSDIYFARYTNFKSYGYLEFSVDKKKFQIREGENLRDSLLVKNIWGHDLAGDTSSVEIGVVLRGEGKETLHSVARVPVNSLRSGNKIPFEMPVALEKGEYTVLFGVHDKFCSTLWNSPIYPLMVR